MDLWIVLIIAILGALLTFVFILYLGANVQRKIHLKEVHRLQLEKEQSEEHQSNINDDLIKLVLTSHDVICEVKKMGPKEAYGQDPIMYYSLAINGEAGEMANKIVKGHRNGYDEQKARQAVISELPDIIIYSIILAFVTDINLLELVRKKVKIVIDRARSGYYGHEIQ